MTLHNLKVFIAVCEEGTMTDAAKKLNMTQPGVSKIISEMERYYESVFFIRKNRRFYLTAAGKQFLEDSRKVIQAFSTLEGNARHNQETKSIILGCTSGFGFSMVSDVENAFHERYPKCRLYLRDSSSKTIRDMVIRGECNLALIQHSSSDERLHQEVFCQNSLIAVCAPDYKLNSTSGTLTIEDLSRENLILLEKERATRTLIDKVAMEKNIVLNPIWTSSSPSNVKELAARGEGVAILFEIQVRKELASGKLVQIPTDLDVTKNFYIIFRNDIWLTEEEQYLIQLCREYAP
ncbi:MAG: LysR family transcriptional regulator [Spirochaetales bacterium]|nr:LysR family transcriptional regulator [Spirochaetales bacterium]